MGRDDDGGDREDAGVGAQHGNPPPTISGLAGGRSLGHPHFWAPGPWASLFEDKTPPAKGEDVERLAAFWFLDILLQAAPLKTVLFPSNCRRLPFNCCWLPSNCCRLPSSCHLSASNGLLYPPTAVGYLIAARLSVTPESFFCHRRLRCVSPRCLVHLLHTPTPTDAPLLR